jgi:hypothetical protein
MLSCDPTNNGREHSTGRVGLRDGPHATAWWLFFLFSLLSPQQPCAPASSVLLDPCASDRRSTRNPSRHHHPIPTSTLLERAIRPCGTLGRQRQDLRLISIDRARICVGCRLRCAASGDATVGRGSARAQWQWGGAHFDGATPPRSAVGRSKSYRQDLSTPSPCFHARSDEVQQHPELLPVPPFPFSWPPVDGGSSSAPSSNCSTCISDMPIRDPSLLSDSRWTDA